MPSEYKLIKKAVNTLKANNDLGQRAITFKVITGSVASYYAKEIGLCHIDYCSYFRHLNPYKKHKDEKINNIINLSYFSDRGDVSASTSGTVVISRSYLRTIDKKENFLACTIGHELTHIFEFDYFDAHIRSSHDGKDLSDEDQKKLLAKYQRQGESQADVKGQEMVIRAGYPVNSCIKEHEFLMKVGGAARKTTDLSTHPSDQDRIQALKDSLNIYKIQGQKSYQKQKTLLNWEYNRDLNSLTFIPHKRR